MKNLKNIDAEDLACLLSIMIGGVIAILHPDKMGEAMQGTIGAIVLIKLFW